MIQVFKRAVVLFGSIFLRRIGNHSERKEGYSIPVIKNAEDKDGSTPKPTDPPHHTHTPPPCSLLPLTAEDKRTVTVAMTDIELIALVGA